jgi:hypothetical protein
LPGDGRRLDLDDIAKTVANEAEKKGLLPKSESPKPDSATSAPPTLIRGYDRFTDKTLVEIQKVLIFSENRNAILNYGIGEFWLLAGYEYKGQQKVTPAFVVLGFSSIETTSHTEFMSVENRNLILLVDGERLPLGVLAERLFHIERVGNEERLELAVPLTTFMKIANAKMVEGRLGRVEFALKDPHLAALRALLDDISRP